MNKNGKEQLKHGSMEPANDPPLPGLYVHWPFCVSKCPYCDFNSHVKRVFDERSYIEAICSEIDYLLALQKEAGQGKSAPGEAEKLPSAARSGRVFLETGPQIGSIYFGGGTPSLMQPATLRAILDHIGRRFVLADNVEITLEANPCLAEAGRFGDFADAGVNRLSLGVQALDDEALKILGRAHGKNEAIKAIAMARNSFQRMSFDLIYGRHGQSLAQWRKELAAAIDLCCGHLSLYQLTIEPGTQYQTMFDQGRLDLPAGERAARFFYETRRICERAGLAAYEISNHAAPGQQSRHNLLYWRYGLYWGVGPGAHGRIQVDGRRYATSTLRSPRHWAAQVARQGHGLAKMEPLCNRQQADEILLMGLRLRNGVDLAQLCELTGFRLDKEVVMRLCQEGYCRSFEGGRFLAASGRGTGVLNRIVEQLSLALVPGRKEKNLTGDLSCLN